MNVLQLGLVGLGVVAGAAAALYAAHRMPALTSGTGPVGGPPLQSDPHEWTRVLAATGDLDEGSAR